MTKENSIEIIKNAFNHFFCEENYQVGNITILLYFPSMGVAILDTDDDKRKILDEPGIEDMDSLLIKKELGAKTVYLDLQEDSFSIGYTINDILHAVQFDP